MLDIKDYNYKRESHPCQGSSFIPDWETLLTLIFTGHGWHSFVKLHKYNESGFISSVSKIVTFIQYHLKQGTREGNGGEVMREKRRKWAREESESYVLRGRVSFTRRGEQGQTPECPSPLSWVTKAGTLPGIPCHHCHGDPHVPTAPAAGDGALGSGLISGITGRGTHAHLGEPLLLTVHRPPQPWNRKCSNGVQRRGGEGLWVQENHSRGSPHPVMYHRCPSLLRVSALTLQEQSSRPGGKSSCWDGPRTVLKAHLGKPPAPDLSWGSSAPWLSWSHGWSGCASVVSESVYTFWDFSKTDCAIGNRLTMNQYVPQESIDSVEFI